MEPLLPCLFCSYSCLAKESSTQPLIVCDPFWENRETSKVAQFDLRAFVTRLGELTISQPKTQDDEESSDSFFQRSRVHANLYISRNPRGFAQRHLEPQLKKSCSCQHPHEQEFKGPRTPATYTTTKEIAPWDYLRYNGKPRSIVSLLFSVQRAARELCCGEIPSGPYLRTGLTSVGSASRIT